jgi:hypothetical protein
LLASKKSLLRPPRWKRAASIHSKGKPAVKHGKAEVRDKWPGIFVKKNPAAP